MVNNIVNFYQDYMFVKYNGFDDCIIGVCDESKVLIYSMNKMIQSLQKNDGMALHEAIEYFDFNIASIRGNNFPIICVDFFGDEV